MQFEAGWRGDGAAASSAWLAPKVVQDDAKIEVVEVTISKFSPAARAVMMEERKVVVGGRAKKGRLLRAGTIYCDALARSAPLRLWSSVTVSAAVAPSGEVEAAAAYRAVGFLFS